VNGERSGVRRREQATTGSIRNQADRPAIVGSSHRRRLKLVTAKARSRPDFICGTALIAGRNMTGVSPPSTSSPDRSRDKARNADSSERVEQLSGDAACPASRSGESDSTGFHGECDQALTDRTGSDGCTTSTFDRAPSG
jgi:hypothetical protein